MAESAFTWGNAGEKLTPSERRRRIAQAMIQRGSSTAPIQHWTQGAARVAEALLGGYEAGQLDREEKAAQAQVAADAASMGLPGAGAAVAPASSAAVPTANPSAAVAATPAALAPVFTTKEAEYKLPTNYLPQVAKIESSFNPSAANPNSSARGLFQFTEGTARDYGLANPMDPIASTDAAARLAADNAKVLTRALGRAPTAGELYLAHQQGGGGASKLLANPNARAIDVVGRDAVLLNGGHEGMTAGEFARKWTQKVAQNEADMPAPGATVVEMSGGKDGFFVPPGAEDPNTLRSRARELQMTDWAGAKRLMDRAAELEASPSPAPGVPFAATESDVQRLEAQMQPNVAADVASAPPAPIPAGQQLAPAFAAEGVAQPWMGTALPAAAPAPVQVAQAPTPMPPPRPADLAMPQADLPAPGAVPAIGQMPPSTAPVIDPNSPDAGMRAQIAADAQGPAQSPFARVVAALGGQGAPVQAAAAPSPAVQTVAQAMPAQAAPAPSSAPSAGVDRVASAMRVLNSPYAQPGQRAVAQMIVQQAFKDPAEVEMKRLQLDKARREAEAAPLDLEGRRLDIEGKKKSLGKADAPTVQRIKQPDGSEVAVQWDQGKGAWVPLAAPEGGNAVGGSPSNPYALPGKPTEDQSKSAGFANRMAEAHTILDRVEEVGADKGQTSLDRLPFGLNNMVISKERQSYNQAKENFITAVLRKESGAVISPSEFETEERKYFPRPGDTPEQIAQKRQSRITAMKSMMGSAGSGYKIPDGLNVGEKKATEGKAVDTSKPGNFKFNPATGKMEPA